MKKKIKNNIKETNSIKSVICEVFTDQRTQMTRSVNEEALQKLCLEMIKEVEKNDDIVTMGQVYAKWGILPNEFFRLKDKHKDVENAYKFCVLLIAIRREKGGLFGRLNPGMIERSMPMYCDSWKDLVSWKADIQTKNAQGYQTINVQMAHVPNSDLVPVRKVESLDVGNENE